MAENLRCVADSSFENTQCSHIDNKADVTITAASRESLMCVTDTLTEKKQDCDKITSTDIEMTERSAIDELTEKKEGCDKITSTDIEMAERSVTDELIEKKEGCDKITSTDIEMAERSVTDPLAEKKQDCDKIASTDIEMAETSVTDPLTEISHEQKQCQKGDSNTGIKTAGESSDSVADSMTKQKPASKANPQTKMDLSEEDLLASSIAVPFIQLKRKYAEYLKAEEDKKPPASQKKGIFEFKDRLYRYSKKPFNFEHPMGLEDIRKVQSNFVKLRGWEELQTAKNITLALIASVGKIADSVAFKSCEPALRDWVMTDIRALSYEMSDALSYVIRLADHCRIDLPMEMMARLGEVGKKDPEVEKK